MARKPVPGFMKTYMENIGPDSWADFDNLAHQYHNKIQRYHGEIYPGQATNMGNSNRMTGERKTIDQQAELSRYAEEYKGKALELACEKYGYEDPGYRNHDDGFSGMQEESSAFSQKLNTDDFGKTPEDLRADTAHAGYTAKNPKTQQERADDRRFVEEEYGENRPDYSQPYQRPQQNPTKPKLEPKREEPVPEKSTEGVDEKQNLAPTRYEQQLSSFTYQMEKAEKSDLKKDFAQNSKDIATDNKETQEKTKKESGEPQPSQREGGRYLSSLSSERSIEDPQMPDMSRVQSQEKNDLTSTELELE